MALRAKRRSAQSLQESYLSTAGSIRGRHADDLESVFSLEIREPSFEEELETAGPYIRVSGGTNGTSFPRSGSSQNQPIGPVRRRTPPPPPPKPQRLRTNGVSAPLGNISPPPARLQPNYFVLSSENVIVGGDGTLQFLHMRDELNLTFDEHVFAYFLGY